eukprot:4078973-Amphidinium_carterae.1
MKDAMDSHLHSSLLSVASLQLANPVVRISNTRTLGTTCSRNAHTSVLSAVIADPLLGVDPKTLNPPTQ